MHEHGTTPTELFGRTVGLSQHAKILPSAASAPNVRDVAPLRRARRAQQAAAHAVRRDGVRRTHVDVVPDAASVGLHKAAAFELNVEHGHCTGSLY